MRKVKANFLKIIADNRPGIVADISRLLAKSKINIEDISALGFGEKGLVVLLTSNQEKTVRVLQDAGYSVLADQGFVVKLDNRPGAFAKVADLLAKKGINIGSVSAIGKDKASVYIVLMTDQTDKAKKLLKPYAVTP